MGKHKRERKRSRERESEEEIRKKILRLERKLEAKREDSASQAISDGSHQDQNIPANNQNIVANVPVSEYVEVPNLTDSMSLSTSLPPQIVDKTLITTDEAALSDALPDVSKKLDSEIEDLLGEDPAKNKMISVDFHQSLVARWSVWLTEGLPKEVKEKIMDKYPRKGNLLLEAPVLNDELVHSMGDTGNKRDNLFKIEQNLAGSALSALGEGLTMILNDEDNPVDRMVLLERLADVGKLLSQLFFQISSARKAFIAPFLSKPMKEVLQKTKPGTFLYGEKLSNVIKTAKSLEKMGKEIKNSATSSNISNSRRINSRNYASRSLNWRGPYARQGTQYQGRKNYPQKASYPTSTQSNNKTSQSSTKQTKTNQPAQKEKN